MIHTHYYYSYKIIYILVYGFSITPLSRGIPELIDFEINILIIIPMYGIYVIMYTVMHGKYILSNKLILLLYLCVTQR